jgi:hypothetical protein
MDKMEGHEMIKLLLEDYEGLDKDELLMLSREIAGIEEDDVL